MANYTAEYSSTKYFYFDLNNSYVITVAAPRIQESIPANLNGIVTNVVMEIGMRVNASKNITLDRADFILFKYFNGCMPKSWKLYDNKCYRYTSSAAAFMSVYNENTYEPYVLAKGSVNSLTWSGEKVHTGINFTPTEIGKNIQNWNGEICLAVVGYDPGSEHTYWNWDAAVGHYTLQYAQESRLFGLPTSFQVGSQAAVNISSYSETYTHLVTWTLGESSHTSSYIAPGATHASYTIPISWRSNFGVTETKKVGSVSIQTFDSNNSKIGETKSYSINYLIDDYNYNNRISSGNITKISGGERFTNDIFNSYLVSNYDSFSIPFKVNLTSFYTRSSNISVIYNNKRTSKTYSSSNIDTTISVLAKSAAPDQIRLSLTDKRLKTGTTTINFSSIKGDYNYLTYTPPNFENVLYYRGANKEGTRDDLNGKYGIVKISNFLASSSSPSLSSITNTINFLIKDSAGNKVGEIQKTINSNSSKQDIILCLNSENLLELDKEYFVTGSIAVLSGYSYPLEGKISSSNYLLHFRYSGVGIESNDVKLKSIGLGHAARDISSGGGSYSFYRDSGLLSIAYPIELTRKATGENCFTEPIGVRDGGTGASSPEGAQKNLQILPTTGGAITGSLSISEVLSISGSIKSSLNSNVLIRHTEDNIHFGDINYTNIYLQGRNLYHVENANERYLVTTSKIETKPLSFEIPEGYEIPCFQSFTTDDGNTYPENGLSLRKNGKVWEFEGAMTPTVNLPFSSSEQKYIITSLPAEACPSHTIIQVCQGYSLQIWNLRIDPDGKVYMERNRSGANYTNCLVTSRLIFHVSWIAK